MKKMLVMMALLVSSQAMAVGLTLSPVYTVVGLVRSVLITVVSPFASTTQAISGQNKEQLRAVKDDAIAFIAEGQRSEMLNTAIIAVKENVAELSNASDIEVAAEIIAAAQ
ncbi:hypothetical protein [Bdellovibrio sp. HCB337]|uniref:hypothetical protein n=1 Tax=Bdellovibrio sp. HCB337 TaxID=3394358 RepID=UPI0039A643FC